MEKTPPALPNYEDHLTLPQIRKHFPGVEPARVRPAAEKCLDESGLEAVIALVGGNATKAYPVELLEPIAKELRVPFGDEKPTKA